MKKRIALILGGLALAVLSFVAGAIAAAMYIAKPIEKWGTEFTESFLYQQAFALKSLRDGNPEAAKKYLETVSAFSLDELAKQKSGGAKAGESWASMQAIEYLCLSSHPGASSPNLSNPSLQNSCHVLKPIGSSPPRPNPSFNGTPSGAR